MSRELEPNCVIVDSARGLATDMGLDPDKVHCPFIRVCNGSDCVWAHAQPKPMEREHPRPHPTEHPVVAKFYDRVEKTIYGK